MHAAVVIEILADDRAMDVRLAEALLVGGKRGLGTVLYYVGSSWGCCWDCSSKCNLAGTRGGKGTALGEPRNRLEHGLVIGGRKAPRATQPSSSSSRLQNAERRVADRHLLLE